jgi:chromosome segregation ATPase
MESAKADITKLESQLNRAKKDVESSTTRVGEIENELSALDKPSNGT